MHCFNRDFSRILGIAFVLMLADCATLAEHRTKICLLPLLNASRDQSKAHWRNTIPQMIAYQLTHVRSLQVLPESSVTFAFREIALNPNLEIEPDKARRVGELLQSDWVASGSYSCQSNEWKLSVNLLSFSRNKT